MDVTGEIVCQDCGETAPRTGWVQKYCRPCSAKRHIETKARWTKNHPEYKQSKESLQRSRERKTSEIRKVGAKASSENAVELVWHLDPLPAMVRGLRVTIPFSTKFSKNALWSYSAKGHVYVRDEIKAIKEGLMWALKSDVQWFDGKVWLDIFVMKPDARSDAVNVVDTICDAVSKTIDVDDRWFCIRRLDWSIVKENPRIIVGLSQSVSEHHRCCSHCGTIKPLESSFGKNKGGPRGHTRACKDCESKARKRKKREDVS